MSRMVNFLIVKEESSCSKNNKFSAKIYSYSLKIENMPICAKKVKIYIVNIINYKFCIEELKI